MKDINIDCTNQMVKLLPIKINSEFYGTVNIFKEMCLN